jgi:hypothetical protein
LVVNTYLDKFREDGAGGDRSSTCPTRAFFTSEFLADDKNAILVDNAGKDVGLINSNSNKTHRAVTLSNARHLLMLVRGESEGV